MSAAFACAVVTLGASVALAADPQVTQPTPVTPATPLPPAAPSAPSTPPTAPPAAPAPPASAPASPPPKKGPAIAYEAGTEVTFTSNDPATELYLAHGDVPIGTQPDPYERVGLTPLTIKLAAGTYSLETAAPTQSAGHERFMVEQGRPLHIEVRPGDANVKAIGSVLAGLGVVSIVLGVVAIVSFSPNDSNYNRFGIGLPLILGGAAGCGIGIGMTVLGATGVRVESQPLPHPAAVTVPTLRLAF